MEAITSNEANLESARRRGVSDPAGTPRDIARTTVANLRAFASGGLFVDGSSLT